MMTRWIGAAGRLSSAPMAALLAVALCASLIGCGGGSGGSDAAQPTATPVPTPAGEPTPEPTPTPTPEGEPTPAPPAVVDSDFDSVPDDIDNCPLAYNESQSDADLDGLGDLCDMVYEQLVAPPQGTGYADVERVVVAAFLSKGQAVPYSLQRWKDIFEGEGNGSAVRPALMRYSYGGAAYEYVYLDWVELPEPASTYDSSPIGRHRKQLDAFASLRERGYAAARNKYVLVFEDTARIEGERTSCTGGGIGGLEGYPAEVGFVRVGGRADCLTEAVMIHELLHALGVQHASGAACGTFLNGAAENLMFPAGETNECAPDAPGVVQHEYFAEDIMGFGSGHPGAAKKARLGWLGAANVERAWNSRLIVLDSLEQASVGTKAIVVPFDEGAPFNEPAYWIEYRVDGNSYTVPASTPQPFEYEYVRVWASGDGVRLFDEDALSGHRDVLLQSDRFPIGVALRDGEQFHDPYRGVRIERRSTSRDEGLSRTTIAVQRSALRSAPGAIVVVTPGQQANVSFTNRGDSAIQMGQAQLRGREAIHFSIVSDRCSGNELATNQTCSITLRSTDNNSAVGVRNAVIQVSTSDALRPLANHAIRMVPSNFVKQAGGEAP